MTRDWRKTADYAYAAQLGRAHWAWEFLRRDPDYRADWVWFRQTWNALETDYDKPPQRDFARWKRDPRAYRSDSDDAIGCAADDDRILIECWSGAKWGFYKFPLDSDYERPRLGDERCWREQRTSPPIVGPDDRAYLDGEAGRLALGFDLRLPLKEQFEQARVLLIAEQQRRPRAGLVAASVANARQRWTLYCARSMGTRSVHRSHTWRRRSRPTTARPRFAPRSRA